MVSGTCSQAKAIIVPKLATSVICRIACKAVIENDGKILILREAATYKDGTNIGRYHMPGGRINPGEPYLEGFSREVMEETGLDVAVGLPIYVGEWFPLIRGVRNQIVAIFFSSHSKSREVKLSEEHDDYQWIDPQDYARYDMMGPEDEVIAAYLSRNK